jgi:hypothetical protein
MNGQITPEQAEILLLFGSLVLLVVVMRLVGIAVWRKWFRDAPAENLTQEERDDRRVTHRRRSR